MVRARERLSQAESNLHGKEKEVHPGAGSLRVCYAGRGIRERTLRVGEGMQCLWRCTKSRKLGCISLKQSGTADKFASEEGFIRFLIFFSHLCIQN